MFGLKSQSATTSAIEIQECFNVIYNAYDKNHGSQTTGSEPFKIEINFQNIDTAGIPIAVETERANQSIEEEVKVVQKKVSAQGGSSD